ncbi:MAG: sodium/proline symporter, partial [Parvularculaceae bacterium]
MSESSVVLLTLVIYKVLLISIGLWASRRVKTEDDFFLGGRGVGAFVSGLSYAASTSSAWVLLGFSGFVYVAGVSALWMVPGIWAGYIVMWLWIARPLREETRQLGHITLTDYLTTGLAPATARPIAILSTLLIVFCFVFYIAAQFDAAAKAFVDQFGLGRIEAVLLGAVIILVYCLLGGFWAVSVTDTLQGIVMMVVAIGLPIFAVMSLGGPGEMFSQLAAQAPSDYMHWSGEKGSFVFLGFAMGLASIGLGAFGQPHLLNRLMALKDDKARRQGFAIAMSWAIAVYIGMAMLALAGRAMTGGALADGEVMFYRVASDVLPPVLAGIVIAAILSAVMSTVDSILLAASAAVAHDLGITKRYKAKAVFVS